MIQLILNEEEKASLKNILLEFVYRAVKAEDKRRPEEIAILPAIIKLLLMPKDAHEGIDWEQRVYFGENHEATNPDDDYLTWI